jgi:biotin carboxyl carrier protein
MNNQEASPPGDIVLLVADLLAAVDGTAVTECEFRSGEHRVFVRRRPSIAAAVGETSRTDDPIPADWVAVTSPLTGIYYASESPQSPPFVVVGASVGVGQTIGLIEAMKTFNRIESDRGGTVRAILVGNGAEVQAGQPLLYLTPAGGV